MQTPIDSLQWGLQPLLALHQRLHQVVLRAQDGNRHGPVIRLGEANPLEQGHLSQAKPIRSRGDRHRFRVRANLGLADFGRVRLRCLCAKAAPTNLNTVAVSTPSQGTHLGS